jgi:hypothetical protein
MLAPSGFDHVSTTKSNTTRSIAAHPCKKRRDGADQVEWCTPKIVKGGPAGAGNSEEVGHQGGGLSGIGSIRLPKLGAHPFLLHAELEPEHKEDEDENDEPAHLGNCKRHAKKPGQNAGVDWVTHHGIGTCGDQLVALLNGDGAAPVAAEVLACPDGEEKTEDGEGGSQPEWPITSRPELDVKPGQWDARYLRVKRSQSGR